jgi:arsenate reductase
MPEESIIVFVCEHGAAKSIIAAAYFNKIAGERGLNVHAVARGTNPDQELSPKTVDGLERDGLRAIETKPKQLTHTDIESAQRIISFCELPKAFQDGARIERWNNVPSVSEDYEKAREAIVQYINRLLDTQ